MAEADFDRVDYEPYFEMWYSVMHYPNPSYPDPQPIYGYRGDASVIPCHQHKTCKALHFATYKYPPRVCQGCQVDTAIEEARLREEERHLSSMGGVIL